MRDETRSPFWYHANLPPLCSICNARRFVGLWPDRCDQSFDQFCAPEREVQNITQILEFFGEKEILDYMHTFWKDNTGNDEVPNCDNFFSVSRLTFFCQSFWEHEFNKRKSSLTTSPRNLYRTEDFFPQTVPVSPRWSLNAFRTSTIGTTW